MVNMDTMKVQNLTSNEHVKDLLSRKALPTEKFYTVKSDGWDIHVKETRPAGFDPKKKYPVLLSVYGGPSTQKVDNQKFKYYYTIIDDSLTTFCSKIMGVVM